MSINTDSGQRTLSLEANINAPVSLVSKAKQAALHSTVLATLFLVTPWIHPPKAQVVSQATPLPTSRSTRHCITRPLILRSNDRGPCRTFLRCINVGFNITFGFRTPKTTRAWGSGPCTAANKPTGIEPVAASRMEAWGWATGAIWEF